MKVRWFGQSFFEIKTKGKAGKESSIYFDPFDNSLGLKPPQSLTAEIVFISHPHPDHANLKLFKSTGTVIKTAGEYSVAGIEIKGIMTFHDDKGGAERGVNIVYILNSEDIRVVHLGDLGHTLNEQQIKALGKIDLLFVPVGGTYTLNGEKAAQLVKQLDPQIVIPMHYKLPGIKLEIEGVEKFCDALGITPPEPLKQLSLKANQFSKEEKKLEIVLLEKI